MIIIIKKSIRHKNNNTHTDEANKDEYKCTVASHLHQTLPNQNSESGDIRDLLHGICHWLTSSDPSFTLILKSSSFSHRHLALVYIAFL